MVTEEAPTMRTEIYYFSGTGNSLATARSIAEKTNAALIAIPSVMDKESIESDADAIGIVFPVLYATNDCGVPLIISRFVSKLKNINAKYIFAVCTHAGMPGTTIENLRKAVKARGGELAAGFTVKMRNKKLDAEKQRKISVDYEKKLDAVCAYVAARKEGKFENRSRLRKLFFAPELFLVIKPVFSRRYRKLANVTRRLPFSELVPLADRSFQVNDRCNGCGTCAKVCPANNIKIVDGKPVWQHHCETCFACYTWCPNQAIQGEIVSYAEGYHHPRVKLSDMLKQS